MAALATDNTNDEIKRPKVSDWLLTILTLLLFGAVFGGAFVLDNSDVIAWGLNR